MARSVPGLSGARWSGTTARRPSRWTRVKCEPVWRSARNSARFRAETRTRAVIARSRRSLGTLTVLPSDLRSLPVLGGGWYRAAGRVVKPGRRAGAVLGASPAAVAGEDEEEQPDEASGEPGALRGEERDLGP
jgi:hypothetical protein